MADGKIVISVDVDGKNVKTLNSDLDQLQGKSTKASSGIKNMAVAMGAVKVAGAAFNVLKSSLDGAISRFDTFQKFPKVMAALGFSTDDSKKSMDKLSEGIDGLPTTLDDVVASTQQMAATTGDLDRSTDTVIALNNAFLASGASSEDATRGMQQYNQMLSNGTVDLDSWKTIQETMPLALQKTAEAMGFTGATAKRDLYQALQDGEVTFDQFSDSLIELGTGTGDLAKLAKENSLGIATSITNLKNSTVNGLEKIIEKFDELSQKLTGKSIAEHIDSVKGIINSTFSAITDSMDKIIPIIDKVKAAFTNLGDSNSLGLSTLKWSFGVISDAVGVMGDTIFNYIPDVIDIFKQMAGYILPALDYIVDGLATLGTMVVKVVQHIFAPAIDTLIGIVQGMIPVIGPIVTGIAQLFSEMAFKISDFVVNQVIPVLDRFRDFLYKNGDAVKKFGVALADLALAFGAFKAVSSVVGVITKIGTAIKTVSTVISVIKSMGVLKYGAMVVKMLMGFMSPIGLVVTALTALAGVFVYLWQTNETFRNKVIEIWNAIVSFLQPIIETITTFITEKWTALTEWWSENQQGFFDKISEIWNAIVETVQPIIQAISDFIMQVWGTVVDWWNENQQLILDTTLAVWEAIKEVFSGVMTAISSIVEVAMELIYIVVSTILGNIKAFWDQWGSTIKTIVKAIWTVISNIFQGTLKNILTIVTSIITQIKTIIQSVMTIIKGIINVTLGIIKGDWNRVLSGIKQIVSGFKSYVTSTFSNLMSTAKSLVSNGIQAVKNTFNSLRNIDLFSVGRNIIQGLVNGISSMVGAVASEISKVAGNIKSKIKGALGIHSPSRWMRDMIGKNMMLGWEIGIDKNAKIPAKAMEDATDLVIPKVSAERVLLANGSAYRGTNSQTINNNSSSVKTIENKPLVTMNVIWQGKEDIKRTMETMGWIVNVDKKGALE
ncbi:MAG TPA: tape measure protein [Companilactobacillus farciminis]|uniref:Tape measure protein n=1 Tax=Companilactobacillus farciminis TaxID=1612 RepID=A0A921L9U6_9LACO|nr:tape measure protein [Companilactobacillus farciminis]